MDEAWRAELAGVHPQVDVELVDRLELGKFQEDAPADPSANLKAMRLSDLLRMSTGHQSEPPRKASEPWAKTFLAQTVPFKPGTHFLYNTSATYMLSGAVQKATGQIEKTHRVDQVRKDIARIKTHLRAKQAQA